MGTAAVPNTAVWAAPGRRPRFSVIVPTVGRRTLTRTLQRLRLEDSGDLQVIVVSDGRRPRAEKIVGRVGRGWPALEYVTGPRTKWWGDAQRMEGIQRAQGDYLLFIDDDDVYRRGAFTTIRQAASEHPNRIIVFRMMWPGTILWAAPKLTHGNVGTPMMLIPNVPGRVGSWATAKQYASDFYFLEECIRLQGEPVWRDEVIALVNQPRGDPRTFMQRLRGRIALRTRLRRVFNRTFWQQ